jgi:hypothetical protein
LGGGFLFPLAGGGFLLALGGGGERVGGGDVAGGGLRGGSSRPPVQHRSDTGTAGEPEVGKQAAG